MANATTTLSVIKSGYVRERNPDTVYITDDEAKYDVHSSKGGLGTRDAAELLFYVSEFPSALRRKSLVKLDFVVSIDWQNLADDDASTLIVSCGDFNPETLTYNNRPTPSYTGIFSEMFRKWTDGFRDITFTIDREHYPSTPSATVFSWIQNFIINRGLYASNYANDTSTLYYKTVLTDGVTKPYLLVTYDDETDLTSTILYKSGPISGYRNPRKPIEFAWYFSKANSGLYCVDEEWQQSSAVFYWKTIDDETYTPVAISGNVQSITIPGTENDQTFPILSTIQWYVSGTDEDGTTTQTRTFSFSTSAPTVKANITSPVNTIEIRNQPIVISWNVSSASIYGQSAYRIEWKRKEDTNWATLAEAVGSETSYVVPENTFPTGAIQLRITLANIDGIEGESTTTDFICYGAPDAPVVDIDEVPFATISWQSADQVAYEIEVDGEDYGPYFGTSKSFSIPDYLEDGTHEIKVRVMGDSGFWSEWNTKQISITNIPGNDLTLKVLANVDAYMNWNTNEDVANFYVYRNGKQIARTSGNEFVDRYSNGEVEYYVINRLPSGNYSKSRTLERTIKVESPMFALLDGGEWLKIRYSLQSESDPSYTDTQTVTYNQISGDIFPSVSIDEHLNTEISFSAVFLYTDEEDRKRFEGMLGKKIIVKFQDGWCGVCVISSWIKQPKKHYYTAYTFTLHRIEWEDFVDERILPV